MAEMIFDNKHIQTGDRIKIPRAVLENMELKKGQKIKIRFDIDKKIIIIEKDNKFKKRGKNG